MVPSKLGTATERPSGANAGRLPEHRNAEIAAHGEDLAVGTQRHRGAVDRAVARIDDVALPRNALRFMPLMKDMPSNGAFLRSSVHLAQDRHLIGVLAGPHEQLCKRALEDAVADRLVERNGFGDPSSSYEARVIGAPVRAPTQARTGPRRLLLASRRISCPY